MKSTDNKGSYPIDEPEAKETRPNDDKNTFRSKRRAERLNHLDETNTKANQDEREEWEFFNHNQNNGQTRFLYGNQEAAYLARKQRQDPKIQRENFYKPFKPLPATISHRNDESRVEVDELLDDVEQKYLQDKRHTLARPRKDTKNSIKIKHKSKNVLKKGRLNQIIV